MFFPKKPPVQLSWKDSFQVKRLGIAEGLCNVDRIVWPRVSHLLLKCRNQFGFGVLILHLADSFPSLQRLEMSAQDGLVSYITSSEAVNFFAKLQSRCPRLDWLDVNMRIRVPIKGNGGIGRLRQIHWPQERQTLRIVCHQQPEEGEGARWLQPWRHFELESNVRVVDDPEELRQNKKEAEKQWLVSPYQLFP